MPKENKFAVLGGGSLTSRVAACVCLLGGGGLTSRVAAGVSWWWWRRLSLEYVKTAVNIDEVRTT